MKRLLAALLCFCGALGSGFAQSAPADRLRGIYRREDQSRLVPLLTQVLRFPTVAGNEQARRDQQQWLRAVGEQLGLTVRDAGLVTEVELVGPAGAPVLGLVVHGDVQPVNASEWTFPPFAGVEKNGVVYGRGAADDKGPLVQALLAMDVLRRSGLPLTHTVRLLVGSDEESTNLDIAGYLKDHKPPYLSLVLDSNFPVVVGEKAWNSLTLTSNDAYRIRPGATSAGESLWAVQRLDAGLAASIVPSQAVAELRWAGAAGREETALTELQRTPVRPGYKLHVQRDSQDTIEVIALGHAAHAGVNLEGGRNALVLLARALHGHLAPCGAADLLEFAEQAGRDLYGGGLGVTANDPLWGRYAVNVATIKPAENDPNELTLTINIRSIPPMTGRQLQAAMARQVEEFNRAHGSSLASGGYYKDTVLAFDPESRIVRRLLADYDRVMGGRTKPAISGGGTYAKRLPNSIAFGMWFPDKPYPGHDVDEQIAVADLNRGEDVLLEVLADIALSPQIRDPFGK
jgi:succinyl-diaminopimelate desuccinylase